MSKILDRFLHIVDVTNDWVGKITSFFIPVIMLIVSYEVVSRYVFNAPTIWAWDINVQLFAIIVFLGGGYTLLYKGHVNVDVLYSHFSEKGKAIAELITAPIFFIFLITLLWKMGVMTLASIKEREIMSTIFAPPLYPMKVILYLGLVLFFMQGIAKLIRDIRTVANINKNSAAKRAENQK